ncbi:hypothetical protein JOB18_006077 [Solea senegalensis]|uniref:Uncharacterized protein n=1 Tax=Solea senegalensis TaxID=28829 RepID=A0AAV6RR48_SOLSE|nr:hypothetical protein JOB18_006077 [Solea senegalensis]
MGRRDQRRRPTHIPVNPCAFCPRIVSQQVPHWGLQLREKRKTTLLLDEGHSRSWSVDELRGCYYVDFRFNVDCNSVRGKVDLKPYGFNGDNELDVW